MRARAPHGESVWLELVPGGLVAPPRRKGEGRRCGGDRHQWPLPHGVVGVVVVGSLSLVGAVVVDVSPLSGGGVSVVMGVVSVGAALVPPIPVGASSVGVVVPMSLGVGCVALLPAVGCDSESDGEERKAPHPASLCQSAATAKSFTAVVPRCRGRP